MKAPLRKLGGSTVVPRMAEIGASASLPDLSAKVAFCNRMIAVNFFFQFLVGVGMPAPLVLGESGASSVKGGSERRVSAAWIPLIETGRSIRGQPDTWLPHDGGPRDRSSKLTPGYTNGVRHSMPRRHSRI
jgi:hypothetical protein